MTEELLSELKVIRDLLVLSNKESLLDLQADLNDKQTQILQELGSDTWEASSDILGKIADDHDVTSEAVRQQKEELKEIGMIEQRGRGSGTKLRKTSKGKLVERALDLQR